MAPANPSFDPHSDPAAATPARRVRMWPQRWRWRISLLMLIALAGTSAGLWLGREEIAGNLIDDALTQSGLEAQYDIVVIGPRQQVIENLVIGDPRAPDLTVERVIVDISYTLGAPEIGRVELVRPRLYGRVREGRLSLGSLDPLIYAESDAPPALPALNLAIVDGRARIDSDFGVIGAKFEGEGMLDDGFAGTLAATAPGLGQGDCRAAVATLYGAVSVEDGKPGFKGPVRLREVACAGAQLARADVAANLTMTKDFADIEGDFGLDSGSLGYADTQVAGLSGAVDLRWRLDGSNLTVRHDLTARNVATPMGRVGKLGAEGDLRLRDNLARTEWSAQVTGEEIDLALDDGATLAGARAASAGTFAGALLAKFERGLAGTLRGGRLAGDVTLRSNPDGLSVIVPEARLRSGAGETVLAFSRVSYASPKSGSARLSGNFLTGGANLPLVNGRMEQVDGNALALRMTMAEYRSGADALAIPRLELRQDAGGLVSFDGMVQASGALPGGTMRGLRLPLEGSWSARDGLAIGRNCAQVQVAALELYQLALSERSLRLCPEAGGAMVRYADALEVAVASSDLELVGALGEAPVRIAAERAMVCYPGPFALTGLEAEIGAPGSAVRMSAATFEGALGETVAGSFAGGSAAMDVVPLDLTALAGGWRYADGVFSIAEGIFTLSDRPEPGAEERFEPLRARGAVLELAGNDITAQAPLRNSDSGQVITTVAIRHDLGTASGRADIAVPGVRFGPGLQPTDLSGLATGVIALAAGTVSGEGRVEWTAQDISSSGTFRTEDFDFAAAFGPVRGVRGEIVFTDLLGLTTAPSQVLTIGSVNPGIEALGGRIVYAITGGTLIRVEDGRWPFMGGELVLRPVLLDYGGRDGQGYVFELIGLDAETFVAQMELSNIGAKGTFDGTIPIYFDAEGNGTINGGLLISRAPGGNVAYVGELTYEDLGTMANYAFEALRSLDYRQMSVELNGALAGEIVTNFQIDGVRQGTGASQNFVTRRLAKLPIRFKINVRSENFYTLATIVRGMFDPTVFGDPVDQGILGVEDGRIVPRGPFAPTPIPAPSPGPVPEAPANPGDAQRRDEPAVQPPESDRVP